MDDMIQLYIKLALVVSPVIESYFVILYKMWFYVRSRSRTTSYFHIQSGHIKWERFRKCIKRGGYRGSVFSVQVTKSTFSSLRVLDNCLSSLRWGLVAGCLIPVYSLKIDPFPGYRIQNTILQANWKAFSSLQDSWILRFSRLQFWLFHFTRLKNYQIQFTGKSITPLIYVSPHGFYKFEFVATTWIPWVMSSRCSLLASFSDSMFQGPCNFSPPFFPHRRRRRFWGSSVWLSGTWGGMPLRCP